MNTSQRNSIYNSLSMACCEHGQIYKLRVNPFLISFILSLVFSGDILPRFVLNLKASFFVFHNKRPCGFFTELSRCFPANVGRVAGDSIISVEMPNSLMPCAGDSSGTASNVRFPVPPLSFRFFFFGTPASVSTEVLALRSPRDGSSSRAPDSVVSSVRLVITEAVRLDLPPPKTGIERPMTEVFAAADGDG